MKHAITILLIFMSLFGINPINLIAACNKPSVSPFDPDAYYATANGLLGQELKSALNSIIKNHESYSYTCVWDILKEADEDPNNSDNVIGLYTRRSIPKADQDQGQNTPDYWNREHVWAKSHGFPSKSQHAYTDAHHLRACDKSVNQDRGNNDFANGGVPDDECTECKEGVGTWEPPDEIKGDIARMMFYMATRYEGSDSSGTPDLELVNNLTTTGSAEFGKLCDLIQWHIADPVSDEELRRNDVIYSWQGNRNPYVDHPEYVVAIWGEECGIEIPAETVPAVSIGLLPLAAISLLFMGFWRISKYNS